MNNPFDKVNKIYYAFIKKDVFDANTLNKGDSFDADKYCATINASYKGRPVNRIYYSVVDAAMKSFKLYKNNENLYIVQIKEESQNSFTFIKKLNLKTLRLLE